MFDHWFNCIVKRWSVYTSKSHFSVESYILFFDIFNFKFDFVLDFIDLQREDSKKKTAGIRKTQVFIHELAGTRSGTREEIPLMAGDSLFDFSLSDWNKVLLALTQVLASCLFSICRSMKTAAQNAKKIYNFFLAFRLHFRLNDVIITRSLLIVVFYCS